MALVYSHLWKTVLCQSDLAVDQAKIASPLSHNGAIQGVSNKSPSC